MADYTGALRFLVQVRRWKKGGGLDGRQKAFEAPTDDNSELLGQVRAGRKRQANALVSSSTGLKTEAAIDWTLRRSKLDFEQRGIFLYWNGKIFEIEELLTDEDNRKRRIVRTREKVRLKNGLY